jgi:hypothetical protein
LTAEVRLHVRLLDSLGYAGHVLGHSHPGFALRVHPRLMPSARDEARRAVDRNRERQKGRPADADRPFRDAVVLGTQTS